MGHRNWIAAGLVSSLALFGGWLLPPVQSRGQPDYHLDWPDRRPIAALFLANSEHRSARNPRGWVLHRAEIDVSTQEGRAEFGRDVLAWADQSVEILKDMDAQGMIVWDIEGQEFDHPTTYIGDPRLAEQRSPEIAPVLDAFFQKFRDAGLRVGMTIRPETLVFDAQGRPEQRNPDSAEQVERTLTEKIAYAKRRWGATLFHIDSNGDPNFPFDARLMARVAAAHPDVLLVPEHENNRYYAFSAPYHELDPPYFITSTPPAVRARDPRAFSIIFVADGHPDEHRVALTAAVAGGDVLMFRGWFESDENEAVKAIYGDAYKH